MDTYGNEEKVQQGECWNFDKLLSASAREYIPYIISSERANPFFVITVASTKFEKNLRYVKSWWNSVNATNIEFNGKLYPFPTFYQTVPVECGELVSGVFLPTEPGKDAFKIFTQQEADSYVNSISNGGLVKRYLYQYIDNNEYKYFYFEYTYNYVDNIPYAISVIRIDGYDCHVRFNFLSKDTTEWGGQNYMYQVTLVSGRLMADELNRIYEWHKALGEDVSDWPILPDISDDNYKTQLEKEYIYVKTRWSKELQPDIDIDSPLGYIEVPIPILPPTKLEVFNNLRTII